jgi:hypothetical protein
MSKKLGGRMSVRILNETGDEIASFFSDKPTEDQGGFSAGLRDALLAFRKKYPKARFIDVEFTGGTAEYKLGFNPHSH